MAVRESLSWLKDRERSHCIGETDCSVVVSTIFGTCSLLSNFGDIVDECKSLLASLCNVKSCSY